MATNTTKAIIGALSRKASTDLITAGELLQVMRELQALEDSVDPDGNPGTVVADTISEYTANAGTTIEGVLIKDNVVTGATSVVSTGLTADTLTEKTASQGVGIVTAPGTITLLPQTGWAVMAGTATKGGFDTATVTLPEIAQVVKAMNDKFRAMGLFID